MIPAPVEPLRHLDAYWEKTFCVKRMMGHEVSSGDGMNTVVSSWMVISELEYLIII